ncbi:hypothetical protein MIND_00360400 [Mycena indigotica]|uniref:Uncharacterized protein n=1 Tax=Mycena indigotica TaxID=2126181 RepID=A0A8H6T443_9AGAR|nr:uncharacterized protein MIND_00360400 [Mycena indigotica]KAF7309881.1 hypothetical protein MIND_00360400 [Mycena indigotica]
MPDAKASPKPASSRKTTVATTPASPGKVPKKVEVHLPGPAPRTASEAKNVSPLTKTNLKAIHARSSSSISSMKKIIDDEASASTKKPTSTVSRKRMATPETADDNTSIAESSVMGGGSIRRTEAERIEYFKNQPDCAEVEPHSVKCTRCNKVVALGRKQTYTVKPWENHRRKCDQKLAAGSVIDDTVSVSVRSEMRSDIGAGSGRRTTGEQRKAELEADPRAERVDIDQVLCRKCQKWVRLSTKTAYALANWNKHQENCGDEMVSSRVAMAKRKITLVNDSQAKIKSPRLVECTVCSTDVELVGDHDYTLTNWELHKTTCSPPSTSKVKAKAKENAATTSKTASSPRSTVSTATESTIVADASTSRGLKRRLEDDELEADDPDARPVNKPRKESYTPVQKEAPGLFGWFLLPFKAFLTGFQESIRDAPP